MAHRLFLAFSLACICFPLFAQFNWQHTGGPLGGGANSHIYSNSSYAFYPDEYFLYRTSDGMNWEKIPESGIWPLAIYGSTLVAQVFQGNTYYYLQPLKLKISHDNGVSWTEGNMPPGMNDITSLAVCSHGIYIPKAVSNKVYRSQDEGLNWNTIPLPSPDAFNLWAFENRLYAGNSSKVWRTDTTGGNWSLVSPTISGSEYILSVYAYGPHVLLCTNNKLWHSHDAGLTWNTVAITFPYREFIVVDNMLYGAGGPTGLARSGDFGSNWENLPVPINFSNDFNLATAGGQMLATTFPLGVVRWDEATQALVAANNNLGSSGIDALTQGGGKVWAGAGSGVVGFDLQQQSWANYLPLSVPNNSFTTIAANDNGLVCAAQYAQEHFYLSIDNGVNWSIIYPNLDFSYIRRLQVLDNIIFLFQDAAGGLLRSANYGQSWTPVNVFLTEVVQFNGQYLGVNTQNQLYASSNQGLSWNLQPAINGGEITQLFTAGDRLFASVRFQPDDPWHQRIYVSENGLNWKYAHTGLPDFHFGYHPDISEGASFFNYAGKYILYHPDLGFYASSDTCKSWLPVERKIYQKVVLADNMLFAGTFSGGGGVVQSGLPNIYGFLAGGTVYQDDDNNGLHDPSEDVIPNVRVGLHAPFSWFPFYATTSHADGGYVLGVNSGTSDTLRPILNSAYVENINPPYHLVGNGGDDLDFGIHLTPNITDVSIGGQYAGHPRPGFDLRLNLFYANASTTKPDATLSLKLDPQLDYLEADPPPTAVFGDSLVWTFAQLALFGNGHIWVNTTLPAATPLGDVLKSVASITPSATDVNPADNQRILNDTVVGSYDPNEKSVEPADGLTLVEMVAGKEILYTVQFQNTGTFTANRVRITDLLDTALYLPSCRLVAASHAVSAFEIKPGGWLEIIFDNLNLPASNTDEPASHGFVTFAIRFKRATYEVRNSAAIYFDFNEPILTNEVTTTLKTYPLAVHSTTEKPPLELLVQPNPTHQTCTLSTGGQISGPGFFTLRNAAGQLCQQRRVADLALPVQAQVANLPDGLYFLELSGKNGAMTGRVIVQHR